MEQTKIKAPKWKIYLMAIGILGFVIAGFILVLGDSSFAERIMGVVCILFFGGMGGMVLYSTLIKGGGNLIVSDQGIELNYSDVPPMLVPWQDIEGFGTRKNKSDAFTTIQLRSYEHLMQAISPKTARAYMKKVKFAKSLAKLLAVAGTLEIVQARGVLRQVPKDKEMGNFVKYLHHSRETYGGEFLIPWNMRDRDAEALAEFLEATQNSLSSYPDTEEDDGWETLSLSNLVQ